MKIETLEEKCSPSSLQQQANTESSDFVIDLRVEGVPDDILPRIRNVRRKFLANGKNCELDQEPNSFVKIRQKKTVTRLSMRTQDA